MENILAQRLADLLIEKNISKRTLALKVGVSAQSISDWSTGKVQPTADMILRLSRFFNCSTDYLLGSEDDFGNLNISGRSSEDLTENERRLLEQFRLMPEARQRTVLDMVDGLAESSVAAGGKKRA